MFEADDNLCVYFFEGGDRILVDPGIGFGKSVEHNLALMRRQRELLVLGRPLYSLRTRFGWALSVDWDRGKSRSLSGGDLRVLTTAPFTFLRDLATGGGPGVWALAGPPAVYRYQTLSGALEGTYSAGLRYKFTLTAGLRFASRRASARSFQSGRLE